MLNPRRPHLIAIVLIVAIFSAACEVPDISEFTKQSAEMTRGIRTGVKDTDSVIKTASERSDLFSDKVRGQLRQNLKDYRSGMKPTLESLDALDAYLESLNALAQANKKSGENAKGVVDAVTNLVTSVSGLTFASSAVNVATGLITLAEQFRTAKAFKKRVNLAALIVEGGFNPKLDPDGNPVLDDNGDPIMVKACTAKVEDAITLQAGTVKKLVAAAMESLTADQRTQLEQLPRSLRRNKLHEWGKINDGERVQIASAETVINNAKCGVIDLIRFNVKDLKEINSAVSGTMLTNAREKNRTVLGFYEALESTDRKIQRELRTILDYKILVSSIKELEATDATATDVVDAKILLKQHADALFQDDAQLKNDITAALTACGAGCGRMQEFVDFVLCDTDVCKNNFIRVITGMTKPQFDRSNGEIDRVLEARAASLYEQNTKYIEELKRITPAHSVVIGELKAMAQKQDQLDQLLDTSVSALDAWAKSHVNLRVAVNTKKPLSVAQLASKVREIWSIISPT